MLSIAFYFSNQSTENEFVCQKKNHRMRKSDFFQAHLLFPCCCSCDPGGDSTMFPGKDVREKGVWGDNDNLSVPGVQERGAGGSLVTAKLSRDSKN